MVVALRSLFGCVVGCAPSFWAPPACDVFHAVPIELQFGLSRYVLEEIPGLRWIGVDIYLEDRAANGEHSPTGYEDALERLRPFPRPQTTLSGET